MSSKLRVNPIACKGHGLCAELFPERISLDDWGFPIVDSTPIPADLKGHARRAVAECPAVALLLERAQRPAVSPRRSRRRPPSPPRGPR
jgi:ferredoxin